MLDPVVTALCLLCLFVFVGRVVLPAPTPKARRRTYATPHRWSPRTRADYMRRTAVR